MKILFSLLFCVWAFCLCAKDKPTSDPLSRLMQGHERYMKGESEHPTPLAEAKDQKQLNSKPPLAVIVGCSDARVPPEIIFDQGPGDLFTVRVAGNVLGPIELDTVEFAVAKLNVPLVMVLGHQDCKAVETTLQGREKVPELNSIYPLIDKAFKGCVMIGENRLKTAINCNIKQGVATLKASSIIAPLIAKGKVKIVGAYYSITEDKVSLISD